jgi:hypothetical protein
MFVLFLVAIVAEATASPHYEWIRLERPKEIQKPEVRGGVIEFAVQSDGQRCLAIDDNGAVLWDCDNGRELWRVVRHFHASDVHFFDERSVLFSNGWELVHLSLDAGDEVKRVSTRLDKFAVVRGGNLVGNYNGVATHALVCAEDGREIADLGGEVGIAQVVAADASGTRFVSGGVVVTLFLGDIYIAKTRPLTQMTAESHIRAACFDPTGRYVVTGIREFNGELAVIDLLNPRPVDILKPPHRRAFGKEYNPGGCEGAGFIGTSYLWYGGEQKLLICKWPELDVVKAMTPPQATETFWEWKATPDGSVIVAQTKDGILHVGRLRKP